MKITSVEIINFNPLCMACEEVKSDYELHFGGSTLRCCYKCVYTLKECIITLIGVRDK